MPQVRYINLLPATGETCYVSVILPKIHDHVTGFANMRAYLQSQGGNGLVLSASTEKAAIEIAMLRYMPLLANGLKPIPDEASPELILGLIKKALRSHEVHTLRVNMSVKDFAKVMVADKEQAVIAEAIQGTRIKIGMESLHIAVPTAPRLVAPSAPAYLARAAASETSSSRTVHVESSQSSVHDSGETEQSAAPKSASLKMKTG